MSYKYRVTLAGIKGFFRVYVVNGANSLYTFHKQLRADLEFPADQQILFKALDAGGEVVARYALVDLGQGTVDEVSVGGTIRDGVVKFIYFYDTKSRKSVEITLEGDVPAETASPMLVESKGPLPIDFENGYVAFEDIQKSERTAGRKGVAVLEDPEEDDDDDEEEDSDREEEQLIYDGEE